MGPRSDGFNAGPLRQSIASGPVDDFLEKAHSTQIGSRDRSEFSVTIQKRLGEAVSRGDDTPNQDRMRPEISFRGNDAFEHRFATLDHRRGRSSRPPRNIDERMLGSAGKMRRHRLLAFRENMDREDAAIPNKR